MGIERFDFKLDLIKISKTKPLLIFGDALTVLRHLQPESIDCIIDDIGYKDLQIHRSIGTTTRLTKKFYKVGEYSDFIPLYRILLKKNRHLYLWRPSLNEHSLQYWNMLINPQTGLLIKNKFRFRKAIPCYKQYLGMGYSYRSAHERVILADDNFESEEIIFAAKRGGGNIRKLNDLSTPDFFFDEWKTPHDKNKTHISEKPTAIYQKIILASLNEGEVVLEPFAGSFQSAMANTKFELKRRVIGIEIDKEEFEKTIKNYKDDTHKELEVKYMDEMEMS